jgi:hypothetical protein
MGKYDFKRYYEQRDHLTTEVLSWLKRKARKTTGLETERGTQSLAQAIGTKGAGAGKDAAGSGAGLVGATARVAGNLATGNLVGAAVSAFDWIKHAAGFGAGMVGMTKAATNVQRIQQHQTSLKKHFMDEGVDDADAGKIVEAIFEVKVEHIEQIPLHIWNPATAEFLQGLNASYEGIENKTFAAVLFQQLQEWMRKFQGHADELNDAIKSLLQQKRQKDTVLDDPEVKDILAHTDPNQHSGSPHEIDPAKLKLRTNVPKLKVGDQVRVKSVGSSKVGTITAITDEGIEFEPAATFTGGRDGPVTTASKKILIKGPGEYDGISRYGVYGIFRRFKEGEEVVDAWDRNHRRGKVHVDNQYEVYVQWDGEDRPRSGTDDHIVLASDWDAGYQPKVRS